MVTLQHNQVTSYQDFVDRLVERFDKKDSEVFFRDLAQLRQTDSLEVYINEFQRLSVMVQDVSERRLVILFTEGLSEPLKGWIKAFDPPSLQEAMKKARGMEFAAPKSKSLHKEIPSKSNETLQQSDKKEKSAPMMDEEI